MTWTLAELEQERPDVPWREPMSITFPPGSRTKNGGLMHETYYLCRVCSVNKTGNDTLHADPEDVRKHIRSHMT